LSGVSDTVTQNVSLTLPIANGSAMVVSGAPLTVPGTSPAGVNVAYNGTLTQLDTIAFTAAGAACQQGWR